MKKPWLAFLLNFFVPGAGLLYLHRGKLALVNFVAAQLVLLGLCAWQPGPDWSEHSHYLLLMVMAASGGWAHAVACQMRAGNVHG